MHILSLTHTYTHSLSPSHPLSLSLSTFRHTKNHPRQQGLFDVAVPVPRDVGPVGAPLGPSHRAPPLRRLAGDVHIAAQGQDGRLLLLQVGERAEGGGRGDGDQGGGDKGEQGLQASARDTVLPDRAVQARRHCRLFDHHGGDMPSFDGRKDVCKGRRETTP